MLSAILLAKVGIFHGMTASFVKFFLQCLITKLFRLNLHVGKSSIINLTT